jgi:response regulator NasT
MHTALVCDTDSGIRETLAAALHARGLRNVLVCSNRDTALKLALDHHPDLVLLEAAPPVNGSDLVMMIRTQHPVMAILLLDDQVDDALFKQAASIPIDSFLTRTLCLPNPGSTVELAIRTAQLVAGLRSELAKARSDLDQRKIIEKAKGLLMERRNISEDAAFTLMRSQSMARRISMAKLAEELITGNTRPGLP